MGGGSSIVFLTDPPLPPQAASSSSKKPRSFPKLGVRLSALTEFFEACGGATKLEGLTTAEVVKTHILPLTASFKSSFCDMLVKRRHKAVGLPTAYVCHTWSTPFLETVEALKEHFDLQRDTEPIVWMDIFSINQHESPQLDFHWWAYTMKSAIQHIGNTLLVLPSWDQPSCLSRSWCLYEVFLALQQGGNVTVVFPAAQRLLFFQNIYYPRTAFRLATVDTESSQCTQASDQASLHSAIRQTMGFAAINEMVSAFLRQWMIGLISQELDSFNSDDSLRFVAQFILAELYCQSRNLAAAKPLYVECMHNWKVLLGSDHENTLCAIHSLGSLFLQLGEFDRAEPLFVECVHRYEEKLGGSHLSAINAVNQLAKLYDKQCKYDQAEKLYQKCCNAYRSVLGDHDLHTVRTVGLLATLYNSQGKYLQSEPLHVLSVERLSCILGPQHMDTLNAKYGMACMYLNTDRPQQGLGIFADCLEGFKSRLGQLHPRSLETMTKLAQAHERMGHADQAETWHLQAIEGYKKKLGLHCPQGLQAILALAAMYISFSQPQYDKAIPLLTQCMQQQQQPSPNSTACHPEGERKRVGPGQDSQGFGESPSVEALVFQAMHTLAGVYYQQDQYDLAEPLYVKCYEYKRQMLGDRHEDTLTTLGNLGSIYIQTNRLQDAERVHLECWTKYRELLGEDHATTVHAWNAWVELLERQDKLVEAEEHWNARVKHCKEELGADHFLTIEAMEGLVAYLERHDQSDRVENAHVKCIAKFKGKLADDNEDEEEDEEGNT